LERRLTVRVAQDGMAAFVTVAAASLGPDAPSNDAAQELRAALLSAGVVAGIDEVALLELARLAVDPAFERADVQLATGSVPAPGRPGYAELAFEEGLAPGRVSADGHMNFFDRGLLKAVATGQVVATVHAPEPAQPGVTVDGRTLPARAGAPAKLKLGAGVAIDAEGVVRAVHGGVVLHKPGDSLGVVAQHVHQGPVDLHTGHLDTRGSLVIKGDVERLLQARASGDLEVVGAVSGGSLRAGGSIRVSGNVRGGDDARVVAEHDATIKSAESAEITAGGVLRVQEAVNSQLRGQQIIVSGRLRGGAAVAEQSLLVKEAGTAAGSRTVLQAGEPLELPDLAEVQRAVMMQKLRRMAERGGVREALGARGGGRGKGGKLGRLDAAWSAEELAERAEHAQRRTALEHAAVLELGLAHPGVELRIGGARLTVEQPRRALRYALDPETGQLREKGTVG
jgi:uncharacterized protein (DUF342 family)